jgi:uncharacterized surface protein with fasciclin (FAS1) repeats
MTAAPRSDSAIRRYTRFKWLVGLTMLAALIIRVLLPGAFGTGSPTIAPLPENAIAGQPFRLSGTAPAGSSLLLTADDYLLSKPVADADGAWEADVAIEKPGEYTLRLDIIDENGAVISSRRSPEPLRIQAAGTIAETTPDPTDPATPPAPDSAPYPGADDSAETPKDGYPGAPATPPLRQEAILDPSLIPAGPLGPDTPLRLGGLVGPGNRVIVEVNDNEVGSTVADDTGNWAWEADPAAIGLEPGTHTVAVTVLDSAGYTIGRSDLMQFAVGDSAAMPTTPLQAEIVDGVLRLSGSDRPGTVIDVVVDEQVVQRVQAADDGSWQFETPLTTPGTVQAQARLLDAEGQIIAQSARLTIEVPAEAISPPLLVESLAKSGNHTILLAALENSGLAGLLDEPGPYTVLAPTDEAFAGLPDGVLEQWLADRALLQRILFMHLLSGSVSGADLAGESMLATTVGTPLSVNVQEDGGLVVGNARVVSADNPATNGLWHAIDQVILPPSDTPDPVIDSSGVATFTGSDLTVVGTAAPGTRLLLTLNGEPFGDPALVAEDGTWLVRGQVDPGLYTLYALTLVDDTLQSRSAPVILTVQP